jgi:hypothetical protein
MGIFSSFKQANQVIEQARRDVAKPRPKDEVAQRRNQKNQGKK